MSIFSLRKTGGTNETHENLHGTGDKGTTRLADGSKISKSDSRIEAYGNVDELNSFVGLLRDEMKEDEKLSDLDTWLSSIQHELFDIGGECHTPASAITPTLHILFKSRRFKD